MFSAKNYGAFDIKTAKCYNFGVKKQKNVFFKLLTVLLVILPVLAIMTACGSNKRNNNGNKNEQNQNQDQNVPDTNAEFELFTQADDTTYTLKVANMQETLVFGDIVTVAESSSWILSRSIDATPTIPSKAASLDIGDNTYYVLVTANNGDVKLYTMQIRRRPIYTVSFNTNGGTNITAQNIEEDGLATAPAEPTKTAYTFMGWNFDFGTPITANTTVNATYTPVVYNITYTNLQDRRRKPEHGKGIYD